MAARRPTAADRDLAEWIRNLPIGTYRIDVYYYPGPGGPYTGLAQLKREGQLTLNPWGPTRIDIYPTKEASE